MMGKEAWVGVPRQASCAPRSERFTGDGEARPTARRMLTLGSASMGALLVVATLALRSWWPGFRLVDAPLQSFFAAVGSVTAVATAMFLLTSRREEGSDDLFGPALGFLGMGVLEAFGSITSLGHGFVLLRSVANLVGGALFAAVCLPRRAAGLVAQARRWGPAVVLLGSVVLGLWTLSSRSTLPTMMSQGRFLGSAIGVNVLAGVLFLAAGTRLLLAFRTSGVWRAYLFAWVSLLLGLAALLLPFAAVWGGGWWLWHLVRLTGFLVVMAFLLVGYGRSVSDLKADLAARDRTEAELIDSNRTISVLYGVQRAVIQSLDMRKRLRAAIDATCEGLGFEAAAIHLLEPDGETLAMRAHKGLSRAFANSTRRIRRGEGVSGKALQVGRPVVLRLDEHPSERLAPIVAGEGLRTLASIPLVSAGEPLGTLTLASHRERVFSLRDLELLASIGGQLGTAVHNARLHEAATQELAERKQAEEALRETADYLQKLLDHANAPIIVWDADTRVTRFNNAFQQLTGYSAEEVVGRELAMLFPAGSRAESLAKIEAALAGEFWESVEIPILRKDGGTCIALWNSANVCGEDGRLMATIAQGVDITVRKLAEEGLREAVTALEKSNAELERFAYVASHDLQEPLRTVASYVQLLEKRYGDRLDDDAKDFMGYAVDGAKRMQVLIDDLLAYSRVATRSEPLEPVDVESVLSRVLGNLAVAIEESGADVTHDRLPRAMGDETQLIQLLQNLIENGIKFRGDEPPKVHVGVESEDGKLVFSVSDNGIGIDPEYFERIFVIFQRLHSRGDYPGTGIGLAVAKRIVERHGGRMWVRSEKKKGAVFYFTLVPAPASEEGIVEHA